jgi:hypothetical protein
MAEILLPPWVLPVSPEVLRRIDDATMVHAPAFARGGEQAGSWADPRWGLVRRYQGLRSDERSTIANTLNEAQGRLNRLMVTPHRPRRGSWSHGELFSNNTFASGTTGWTSGAELTISVSERLIRSTRNAFTGAGTLFMPSASVTVTAATPYVARYVVARGRGAYTSGFQIGDLADSLLGPVQTGFGMKTNVWVPFSTSLRPYLNDVDTTGLVGDYVLIPYASLARCGLVDNGVNYLLQSDALDNVAWTLTRATVPSQQTAPNGASTADFLREDSSASTTHFVSQSRTVTSSPADFCLTIAAKPNGRDWLAVSMNDGSNSVTTFFNASTGAVGTSAVGASWANLRTFVVSMGNGYYQVGIIARKTSSSTSIDSRFFLASADNTSSYTGGGSLGVILWRGTLASSPMPCRLAQTTSSALTSGTAQSGGGLYTKGWPVSSSGLLLADEFIEVNGELKQLVAPLDTDAAGMAFLQFRPATGNAPADNDAVVVHEPFGRFRLGGDYDESMQWGRYSDCELTLEESYT